MTVRSLKLIVFISLLTTLLFAIIILFTLYKTNLIDFETEEAPNEFMLIVKKVIGIFSVQISVAIASYLSSTGKASMKQANEPHYIAFSLIMLWLIGFLVYLFINGIQLPNGNIKFRDLYRDIDSLTLSLNFLVCGAIVFLFVQTRTK
ncbi:MAG TPA: hypothetical protein VKA49_18405 [Flavitalea sp.]|nr:hypothetical protein [Flavitalea sp.]